MVADALYTQLLSPTRKIRTRWNNYKKLREKIKYYLIIVIIVIRSIIINFKNFGIHKDIQLLYYKILKRNHRNIIISLFEYLYSVYLYK